MSYGVEGERVRLVPIDADKHLLNCQLWLNDEDVIQWLGVGFKPITMLAERDYFDNAARGDNSNIIWAIELLDGTHIGQIGIHHLSHFHKSATTGILVGSKDHWGFGYGTEAAMLRSYAAFHMIGLRILYSEYLSGNTRSGAMQKRVGYLEWGKKPECWWKMGEYRDMVQTFFTRNRWLDLSRGAKVYAPVKD
ncbi:MAG: GNAT family N-acetyltransferase [Armatimonadetes bacterium]|nr:GNAT family N-acetyltransferase [Armatimonadota bacterium]